MYTNFLYPWARNEFLRGGLNWVSNTVAVMPLNNAFTTCTGSGVVIGLGTTGYAADPNANASEAQWAGWGVTMLSAIPFAHRTFSSVIPQFGGTACTFNLLNKTASYNGVAGADNITMATVPSGSIISAFVLYRKVTTATASTLAQDAESQLIAFFGNALGMPVTGNGGDITIQWSSDALSRIFRL